MNSEDVTTVLTTATNWRKASYSQAQNGCVEVASIPGFVGVRDTKLGQQSPILTFTEAEWNAFIEGLKSNDFDTGAAPASLAALE
ncbi:MAG: DUF397 domain-containing protein [Pseudonocardia sp.]